MWTESGGGGKTTHTINTAHALALDGHDVLVIDGDRQRGGAITDNIGFTEYLNDDRMNVLDAIFEDGQSLNDVILRADDHDRLPFDLIPGTLGWDNFSDRAANSVIANKWMIVRQAVLDAGLADRYDVIIIDAEGGTDLRQKNFIVATQNVVIPTLPNRKGKGSVARGRDFVLNSIRPAMKNSGVDLDFGILAVVPNKIKSSKNVHERTVRELQDSDFPTTPFVFYNRGPAEDAMDRQQSIFQFAADPDTRDLYDYEHDIVEKFDALGQIILNGSVDAVVPVDIEVVET